MSKLELSFQSKILKFRSSAFVTQNEGDIPKSVLDEYIKIEPQFNDAYMKCKKTCVDIVDLINEMGMAPKINKPLDIYISNTTVKERTVTYENELRKFYKTYVTYQKDNKQLNILTFEDFQKQYTPKSRLSFTDKILTGIYNLFKKTTWIPEDSPQINPTEAKLIIPVDMFMKGDSLNISPEYGLISFKKPFSGHENLTVSENEIFKFIFLHEIGHLVFNNIYIATLIESLIAHLILMSMTNCCG